MVYGYGDDGLWADLSEFHNISSFCIPVICQALCLHNIQSCGGMHSQFCASVNLKMPL